MRCTLVVLLCAIALLPVARADAASTVDRTLDAQLAAGTIDQPTHDRYAASWSAAQATLKKLSGRRRVELKAVIANVDALAASRQLVTTRLAATFATLDANRTFWSTSSTLPGYGARVTVPGSELVWQSYPGQGIQLQWLATFGKANGLWTGNLPKYDKRLGTLLDQARALATARAGGIAWEYLFQFDGGKPPWVSSLSQGTALQAYARAAIRLNRPDLMQVAQQGLGIFSVKPPQGVAVKTTAGYHYLQYSFRPSLRILNGFTQAVIGLHDYAQLSGDPNGQTLYALGEAELRTEVPKYDTGAWSLYSNLTESDLGYHTLLRDFLQNLCDRLTQDGSPDPAIYCTTAQHFTAYLKTPPKLALLKSPTPRLKHRARLNFRLDKVSLVTLTIRRDGKVVFQSTVRFGRGTHAFGWGPPAKKGPVAVTLTAKDLAGNVTATSGAQTVA